MKIDCHFHTNFRFDFLPKKFHTAKANKIWEKFSNAGLNAVILTEHVFKKPGKSYKIMMESKPVDSNIRLIPGVECLSKEGIDFLVWCDDTYVYQLEKLMKPKLLSIRELIEFVKKDPKLYCSIAHPFVPSDTAVLFHYDEETLSKLISKAKVVEKHNYSLYTTRLLFRKFLPGRFKNKLLKIEELPDIFTDGYAYTGGSDAHTIDGIGPYLDIHHSELASIHSAIVDPNISREMVVDMNVTFFQAMSETITSGLIVMYESIKKRCNLYSIDRTYFRS